MSAMIWIVALLSLSLPAEYRLEGNTSERVSLPGPPGYYATEEFRSWQAPGGRSLVLFFWKPRPPRDLGPIAVAAEWPAQVAGQKTKCYETSMFMGRKQRVLVTYLNFADPEAKAMLYATGVDRKEFEVVLSGVKIALPKPR
jgi:hypothetical protein